MFNLQIVIIMTKKKKKKKESCHSRDSNTGYMGSKSTKISTALWKPMKYEISDKNNPYMLKL